MTRRDHEVFKYTQTHVKNNSKLTNLRNHHELDSIVVNKGQFHRELRYFWGISWNSIKSDEELRWEIKDFDIFIKITQIHGIKNYKICIKIPEEINEQKLDWKFKLEERENQN